MLRAVPLTVMWVAVQIAATGQLQAGVITFDDLTTRDNFFALEIEDNYQGFGWGYSVSAGLSEAQIPTNNPSGWASATDTEFPIWPPPAPVSGSSFAYPWGSVRSLFIDFQTPHDVNSGYFATLSSSHPNNASSVQLFGYDAAGTEIGASSQLSLTHSFQQLNVGLSGVRILEIRANARSKVFSVDDLDVTPSSTSASAVPEPSCLALCGIAACVASASAARRRRRIQSSTDLRAVSFESRKG